MTPQILKRDITVPHELDAVFAFFSRPENLQTITPPWMKMTVLTPSPVPMHVGAIIDYAIKLNGLPLRWTTAISEYEPPHRFVDVQLKGPYSLWHHTHRFEAIEEGTRIIDEVHYLLPFGPLGAFVNSLKVKKDLRTIFDYRTQVIQEQFPA